MSTKTWNVIVRLFWLLSHMPKGARKTIDRFNCVGGAILIPLVLWAMAMMERGYINEKHVHDVTNARTDGATAGIYMAVFFFALAVYELLLIVRIISGVYKRVNDKWTGFWLRALEEDPWYLFGWMYPKKFRPESQLSGDAVT